MIKITSRTDESDLTLQVHSRSWGLQDVKDVHTVLCDASRPTKFVELLI
jgi:hypothetical protein